MSSVERSVCKGDWMKEPVEFKSKLESIMPAEELLFDVTPAFGIYREFLSHAVAHPAKMNTRMLEFLVKTWTKPGDTVLDPMAGSGSTGVVAALHGRNAILVELEAKFYEWIEKARENVEKYSTFASKGRIVSIHGDARCLSELLNGVDVAITSPPYTNAAVDDLNVWKYRKGGMFAEEKLNVIITSPPYSSTEFYYGEKSPEFWKKLAEKTRRKAWLNPDSKTRRTIDEKEKPLSQENIGNLPFGNVDTVITSPPYLKSAESGSGVNRQREGDVKIGCSTVGRTVTHPEAIDNTKEYGSIDTVITSPPYEASISDGGEGPLSGGNEKKYGRWKKGTAKLNSYTQHGEPCKAGGTSLAYKRKDNIGNLRKETYLEAMSQVYAEMYKVLKPNGLAIIVVKPFQRNLKVVDLPYDTYLLMKRAGFVLEKLYKLRLRQLSFWRVLAYKKHPDVPRIMHEYVIVARKQVGSMNEANGA